MLPTGGESLGAVASWAILIVRHLLYLYLRIQISIDAQVNEENVKRLS